MCGHLLLNMRMSGRGGGMGALGDTEPDTGRVRLQVRESRQSYNDLYICLNCVT